MPKSLDDSSLRAILQRGFNAGLWTLEDLDHPSPDWQYQERTARQSPFFGELWEPPIKHRNLLRDQSPPEAVQPVNPRDLAAPMPPSDKQPQPSPLPQQWPPDLGSSSTTTHREPPPF